MYGVDFGFFTTYRGIQDDNMKMMHPGSRYALSRYLLLTFLNAHLIETGQLELGIVCLGLCAGFIPCE